MITKCMQKTSSKKRPLNASAYSFVVDDAKVATFFRLGRPLYDLTNKLIYSQLTAAVNPSALCVNKGITDFINKNLIAYCRRER